MPGQKILFGNVRREFVRDRCSPIIRAHQLAGKIPANLNPEMVVDILVKSLVGQVVHQVDPKSKILTHDDIIREGDDLLRKNTLLRSICSIAFKSRIDATFGRPRCFTLSGPSGVGKQKYNDELEDRGLVRPRLFNIRNDRGPDELYGVAYHFIRLLAKLEAEYAGKIEAESDKKKKKELEDELIERRAEILLSLNSKHKFISTTGVHEHSGLQSQAVPGLLFQLGREGIDAFVEVDIGHARKIIAAAGTYQEMNVFPIFLLPPDFTTLMWQLLARTFGEHDNGNVDKPWFGEIFDANLNIVGKDAEAAAKKFGQYVGKRLFNGIDNIKKSMELAPLYVENNEFGRAIREIEQACKFRYPTDAAEAAIQGGNVRVSSLLTVNRYVELIKMQFRLLGLGITPLRVALSEDKKIRESYKNEILKAKGRQKKIRVSNFMEANHMSVGLVWDDPDRYYEAEKTPAEMRHDIIIQAGTFSPYHNGHLSSVLAAIKDLNLNGAVIMPGAVPPRRIEITFKHRYEMARIATQKYSFLTVSPLRSEFTDMFQGIPLGGAVEHKDQRMLDLGAFSFLVSMNPGVNFYYLAGVDKVNNYSMAGKNEEELLVDFLLAHKIPLVWQPRKGMRLELFEREWEHLFLLRGGAEEKERLSRIAENEERLKKLMIESTTPTVELSSREKRRKVADYYPLRDSMDPLVIDYIYRQRISEGYQLRQDYENLKNEVADIFRRDIELKGNTKEHIIEELAKINIRKRQLGEEEIVEDGVEISLEQLLEDAVKELDNRFER